MSERYASRKRYVVYLFIAFAVVIGMVTFRIVPGVDTEIDRVDLKTKDQLNLAFNQPKKTSKNSGNQSARSDKIQEEVGEVASSASDIQREVMLPYERKYFSMGELTKSNLSSSYQAEIESALEGDADALLDVADIVWNCNFATEDPNKFRGEHQTELYKELVAIIGECRLILDEMSSLHPELSPYMALKKQRELFLKQALEAGNKVVKLREVNLPNGDPYEAARLIDEMVDSKNYRVLYEAAKLMARIAPDRPIEYEKWSYLACVQHPECNEKVMSNNMDFVYSSAEQNEILDFAERFTTIKDHEYTFRSFIMNRYYGEKIPQPIVAARKISDRLVKEAQEKMSKSKNQGDEDEDK